MATQTYKTFADQGNIKGVFEARWEQEAPVTSALSSAEKLSGYTSIIELKDNKGAVVETWATTDANPFHEGAVYVQQV